MEYDYIVREKRSFIHTAYPFKVFPQKGLRKINYDEITMLYGDCISVHREVKSNSGIMCMNGLDDCDGWNISMEIRSRKRSQSSFINNRVVRDADLHSNGESAMHYFLDESENSLSVEMRIQLMEFTAATARATRSQFVIATHSPIFLSMNNATIYYLDDYPVSVCLWTYFPNVRRFYNFFMEHSEEFLK